MHAGAGHPGLSWNLIASNLQLTLHATVHAARCTCWQVIKTLCVLVLLCLLCRPATPLPFLQVYLSVDALVNRGSLDLIGAVLEANSVLDSLSPDGQKARKARQQRELQETGAGQFRQITRCAHGCWGGGVNTCWELGVCGVEAGGSC